MALPPAYTALATFAAIAIARVSLSMLSQRMAGYSREIIDALFVIEMTECDTRGGSLRAL